MGIYKPKPGKWENSFVIIAGFLALFFILSSFSLTNVYAVDGEIVASDEEIDFSSEIQASPPGSGGNSYSIQNSSPNPISPQPNDPIYYQDNKRSGDSNKGDDSSPMDSKRNTLEIGGKSTLAKIDSIEFYSIFNNNNPNSERDFNDINGYITHKTVIIISDSNFRAHGFDNFNNFIKIVAFIKYNEFDKDEDILIIQDFQSSFNPTLTILFFIKTFMENHNNGKEHLNSF